MPQKHYDADEISGMDAAEKQNVKEQGACMSDVRYQHRALCIPVNPNEYCIPIPDRRGTRTRGPGKQATCFNPGSSVQANNENEYSIPHATIGEVVNTADKVDHYDYVSLRQENVRTPVSQTTDEHLYALPDNAVVEAFLTKSTGALIIII